mgnify:CR=1 FL=1
MRGTGRTAGLELDLLFHPQATKKPVPLVPRRLRVGVTERIDYRGRVVDALREDEVRECIAYLEAQGVEAVAICLLFSFVNPAHEHRVKEILQEEFAAASRYNLALDTDAF